MRVNSRKYQATRSKMLGDDDDYKRAKEAFVAGLEGTSAREVFAVFALMPVRRTCAQRSYACL